MIENYSAIHDQQFGTKANGFGGSTPSSPSTRARFILAAHPHEKWMDDGVLQLAGQGLNPEQVFVSAVFDTRRLYRGPCQRRQRCPVRWNATFLPHEEGVEPRTARSVPPPSGC